MNAEPLPDVSTRTAPLLTADQRDGTVSGPGGKTRIEPKVMEVLTVLARYSGHVVSRQELLDAVWPEVVVTDHTLSRCIYQLRERLGEIGTSDRADPFDPIETLPKRGYRLRANVEFVPPEIRVAGSSLFIELRRPYVLAFGLALFVAVVVAVAVSLS